MEEFLKRFTVLEFADVKIRTARPQRRFISVRTATVVEPEGEFQFLKSRKVVCLLSRSDL